MCEKNKEMMVDKLTVVSLGMCAKLPLGAFRSSGGFHRRGWS